MQLLLGIKQIYSLCSSISSNYGIIIVSEFTHEYYRQIILTNNQGGQPKQITGVAKKDPVFSLKLRRSIPRKKSPSQVQKSEVFSGDFSNTPEQEPKLTKPNDLT